MPAVVRCKTCGKDHPYREDIEERECDNCDTPLKMDNTRMIITPRVVAQADPLNEF